MCSLNFTFFSSKILALSTYASMRGSCAVDVNLTNALTHRAMRAGMQTEDNNPYQRQGKNENRRKQKQRKYVDKIKNVKQ
jgi:hypothetical protein